MEKRKQTRSTLNMQTLCKFKVRHYLPLEFIQSCTFGFKQKAHAHDTDLSLFALRGNESLEQRDSSEYCEVEPLF